MRTCNKAGGWILLVLLVPAACEQPPKKATLSPAACDAEVLELRGWLEELSQNGSSLVPVSDSIRLVKAEIRGALPPGTSKPLVEIQPGSIRIGQCVAASGGDGDGLYGAFSKVVEEGHFLKEKLGSRKRAPALLVAVDREASWSQLVRVHDQAARAGFEQLALLFLPRGTHRIARPEGSSIDAELASIAGIHDPARRVPRLAALAREVCAGCKPLGPVFRSLSVTSPEVRAAVLQGKLPDAVAACGCAADLAALKALLWSMYGRPALIGAWFDIAPAPVDKEAVVSQPTDRPWHQAHRALLPLVKPGLSPRVRFAVEK